MDWKFEKSGAEFERTEKKIGSISEFLDCVQSKWKEWWKRVHWNPQEKLPWFRGVGKEFYELVPRIYRGKEEIGWEYNAN